MRLLCVEDEAALRGDIVEYLRMRDYEVDEAESGEAAIEQLNQHHYDLVLCDIKMPRMDGYELLRQVRRENHLATTPFLFLSALNERNDKIRAHTTGCDGYLTKPVDFAVLDATVKSQVDRQRARDFLHQTIRDNAQRHMMAAIDDALNGSMTSACLILQHLRDTLPVLTSRALDVHLSQVQAHVNAHAVDLHTLHSALMMQATPIEMLYEMMLTEDLIKSSVAECHYQKPDAPIRFKASSPNGHLIHGDMRMLQRALAGLMATIPQPVDSCDVVECLPDEGAVVLALYDHPAMARAQDFVAIDAATNLASLSRSTRQRLIPLSYALQVAHAHNGRLELMIGMDDALATRLVLPQPLAA
ncbi:MAG: response regulator [Alphaproteobacteria bacterium]|nr:response regulator [Alphaproteobacteria bacterium]